MNFKVGDKVRVKSWDWYCYSGSQECFLLDKECNGRIFNRDMANLCGNILEITDVFHDSYGVGNSWLWNDEMLEGKVVESENYKPLTIEEMAKNLKENCPPFYINDIIGYAKENIVESEELIFRNGVSDKISKTKEEKLPGVEEYIADNPNNKLNSAFNTQVNGNHYIKLAIQPMQYSMANKLDALQHTIIKYVTRFRDKNGKTDLLKAKHCIDMLLEIEFKEKD